MIENIRLIPVKDYVFRGITLRATCRNCGRDRIVGGGLLARSFNPEDRLDDYQVHQFAKRLVCGNCGAHWPKAQLVIEGQRQGASPSM